MEKTPLTPAGIPTMSFTAKAEELEKLLTTKTTIEEKVAEVFLEMRTVWNQAGFATLNRDDVDLLIEDIAFLTVHQPVIEQKLEGFVYTCAKIEGRAFSELASSPSLLKGLEKRFGKKFSEFVRQVDDVFHYKTVEKPPVVDVVKTKTVQDAYITVREKYNKLQVELKTVERQIKNVDTYIAFCKSVVALAPAGKPQQQ